MSSQHDGGKAASDKAVFLSALQKSQEEVARGRHPARFDDGRGA